MLHSQQGSIYRIILGCFILCAFVFALSWPQYTKRRNAVHAQQAADLGRALAFAQATYASRHEGAYNPQLNQLGVNVSCPSVQLASGMVLDCPEYTYRLEGGTIWIEHKKLPVWLEVDIAQGAVTCKHAEQDWAGQELCGRLEGI